MMNSNDPQKRLDAFFNQNTELHAFTSEGKTATPGHLRSPTRQLAGAALIAAATALQGCAAPHVKSSSDLQSNPNNIPVNAFIQQKHQVLRPVDAAFLKALNEKLKASDIEITFQENPYAKHLLAKDVELTPQDREILQRHSISSKEMNRIENIMQKTSSAGYTFSIHENTPEQKQSDHKENTLGHLFGRTLGTMVKTVETVTNPLAANIRAGFQASTQGVTIESDVHTDNAPR